MYCLLLQYILSRNRMGHGPQREGNDYDGVCHEV